jgi:hypothetical protein
MNIPPSWLENFPEWKPGDGPVPFVFDDKPAGSRCGWACKWVTHQGAVTPQHWFSVENMTREQLLAELADVVARTPSAEAEHLYQLQQVQSGRLSIVENFLRVARENYPEYVYPHAAPQFVFHNFERPGWGRATVRYAGGMLE